MKKIIITAVLTLLVAVPAITLAVGGMIKYQTSNNITKHYDHDEGVICYTYSDMVMSFGNNMLVGGISCVKDN